MPAAPSQSLVKGIFRVWSHVYDQPVFQWTIYGRIHKRLLEEGRDLRPARVLDIGCGTGELLVAASRKWPDATLTGADLSTAMLDKARSKRYGRDATLVEASVYDLPFESGAFDLVLNTVSSHFYEQGERAFGEIGRVLAKGGTLLQASLTTGPLSHVPGMERRSITIPSSVYRAPAEQRRLLEDAGIDVVATHFVLPGVRLFHGVKR